MLGLVGGLASCFAAAGTADVDWPAYQGDIGGTHWSPLEDLHAGNVAGLDIAWVFDTGDAFGAGPLASEFQCNPLVVDGVLYALTPRQRAIALDARTGRLIWSYDPHVGAPLDVKRRSRGLAHRRDGTRRTLYFGAGSYLHAVDARSGLPLPTFGERGRVDLRSGLGREPSLQSVFLTSPPVVFEDLVIVGGAVSETLPASPGHIRAYDATTGALRWIFRTIPGPGEPGHETWPSHAYQHAGGANNWAGMTLDVERGTLFAPTGSAAFDFYGGDRLGDNLFANTLLALDARRGTLRWHFQAVRHDLWDRDLPAPPALVHVRRNGRDIAAVAQVTKSGHLFVLARDDGRSLFPLVEVPAPPSAIPGEVAAATQLLPSIPAPFARQRMGPDDVTRRTPEAHAAVAAEMKSLSLRGPFDPPSLAGTLLVPGLDGGAEWGGASVDPLKRRLFVNANEMPWILRLVPRPDTSAMTLSSLYRLECAPCHGDDRRGSPPLVPPLVDVGARLTRQEILLLLLSGTARMPGFAHLGHARLDALAEFVITARDAPIDGAAPTAISSPYALDGYHRFLDPEGYPAISPPWGSLTAIDLDTGQHAWRVPLGTHPELTATSDAPTGSENYGGSVATAGGLLFIAATVHDHRIRAMDTTNGRTLWQAELPAAGHATPATYRAGGRQFVVIAAGGGKHPTARAGSCIVAFALPSGNRSAESPPWIDGKSCLAARR
jgi:quinoprotein glucose dehydrogenase